VDSVNPKYTDADKRTRLACVNAVLAPAETVRLSSEPLNRLVRFSM
jgi:hypothetical protein